MPNDRAASSTPARTAETLDWWVAGSQASAALGESVAAAGDVDGDGYPDAIIGASRFDGVGPDTGRARLYRGTPGGLARTPSWTAAGDEAHERFGARVAGVGDVNGDGFDDVIVGSPDRNARVAGKLARRAGAAQEYLGNAGRVQVYLGSSTGLASNPSWVVDGERRGGHLGAAVAAAGDVNGDGFADVVVGAPGGMGSAHLYLGSRRGLSAEAAWVVEGRQANALFGVAVAGAGDVNGDGFDDLLVGASLHDDERLNAGRVLLYLGSPAGPSTGAAWVADGRSRGARFGHALAGAGDVNGDGFADVVVAAPSFERSHAVGIVYAYLGSTRGLGEGAWATAGARPLGRFGHALSAGDLDGDGFSDVVVGAPGFGQGAGAVGRAFAFHGSPEGLAFEPTWAAGDASLGASFGAAVAFAGDLDGDGRGDLLVGAPAGRGRVLARYAPGREAATRAHEHGSSTAARWGVGDVNGDGYADVVATSTDEHGAAGAASLFLGSAKGVGARPVWSLRGARDGDRLGARVAGLGDVDGDGFGELSVYVQGRDEAWIYRGSASGPVGEPERRAGWRGAASAGDVNGDGFGDVLLSHPDSTFELYLGSPGGASREPVRGARRGAVRALGDVDGDGFDDLLVGSSFHMGSAAGPSPEASGSIRPLLCHAPPVARVAAAGDLNGDGYGDVVATCRSSVHGRSADGLVIVLAGSPAGVTIRAPWAASVSEGHDTARVVGIVGFSGEAWVPSRASRSRQGHSPRRHWGGDQAGH